MRRLLPLLVWLLAAPVAAQVPPTPPPTGSSYSYTFTHDRLNTTFYQTCVDSQPCISIGLPATNVATFILADGTHSIKIQACNANGCTPLASATGNPITVTVPPPPPPVCPTVTITPTSLLAGTVGAAYSRTLVGAGGTGPYTFHVTTGTISAGLTLSTAGLLSGTPTTAGTANFTVTATDANACNGSQPYALTIACPAITLSPSSLPTGQVSSAYSQTLTGAGGTSPYTFAVTAGTLATGLTLSSAGLLSGTPTTAQTANFTIRATDAHGCTGTRTYALTIAPIPPICPTITLSPTSLTAGTVGSAYSQALSGVGGTGPYTFAVTVGTVPAGLTLSGAGLLNGTPTTAQTANFTVRATDAGACTGSQVYALTIAPVPCPTITLTPTSLSAGQVGTPYSQTLTGVGGTAAYTFRVTSGALPAGMTLTLAGVLGGSPTTAGTASFTVTATDANNCTGSQAYTLSVLAAPPPPVCPTVMISPTSLLAGQVGVAYSRTLIGSGGSAPYSFHVTTGSLPAGLTLTTPGVLSGTPTTAINATFTVTATDANVCTGTQAYLLSIAAAPPPPPTGTLLDWEFPSSSDPRFAGTSWQSSVGPDGVVGWMGVTGALTTDTSFSATPTGSVRFDWYVRIRDGLVQNGTSADFALFLLPSDGAIGASNSAGSIMVRRSKQAKATSAIVKLQIQNGAHTVVLSTGMTRGVWHKLTILANVTARTSQIFMDDVLLSNITFPNAAILSISRIGLLSGSKVPISDLDKLLVVAQ